MHPILQLRSSSYKNESLQLPKNDMPRNYSVNSQNTKSTKSTILPKSPAKTTDKRNTNENSYISKALANLENGCIDEKTGQIKIDGSIGDYEDIPQERQIKILQ